VVSSADGVDEVSISDRTRVVEVKDGRTEEWFVLPADHGIEHAPIEAIAGGTPEENAAVTRSVLEGEPGPARDVAVLNAGAAILAAAAVADLAEGVEKAGAAIDSGAAGDVLERLVKRTGELSDAG
jgi:anthranilate phosphoribosyltransferase